MAKKTLLQKAKTLYDRYMEMWGIMSAGQRAALKAHITMTAKAIDPNDTTTENTQAMMYLDVLAVRLGMSLDYGAQAERIGYRHQRAIFTHVSASQIEAAIAEAQSRSDWWQAELIEIALIPQVYAIWQEQNRERTGRTPRITRHDGIRDANDLDRDTNWETVAGWVLSYGEGRMTWNSVRADYHSHSPSTCWDGIRRETYSSFIETLRMIHYQTTQGEHVSDRLTRALEDYQIAYVDDRS